MVADSCIKCGKGIAQHGGLCANCMLNTDITDTLTYSTPMPKMDIPQDIFFGPDISDYILSLKKRNIESAAKYNKDKNVKDKRKYDVTVARNGKNSSTTGTEKISINSIVYDIMLNRNGGTPKRTTDNKYRFMMYKPSVTSYSTDKKLSYGVTPSSKYISPSYGSKPATYKGSKSTYSGSSSNSSYSGKSSSK